MSNGKKKQQYNPNDPGHRGGGGSSHEKRNNEPVKKNYRNHNQEHILPSESQLEKMFGDNYKKDRK